MYEYILSAMCSNTAEELFYTTGSISRIICTLSSVIILLRSPSILQEASVYNSTRGALVQVDIYCLYDVIALQGGSSTG